LPDYLVPPSISKVVGGGPNGTAEKLKPDAGWQSVQMAQLFTGTTDQTAPVSNLSSRKRLSKSVVAAIASGAVVGFLVILVIVAWFVWHKRHKKAEPIAGAENEERTEPGSTSKAFHGRYLYNLRL